MSKWGSGEYSIRTTTGMLVEKLTEEKAWEFLLHGGIDPAVELLHKEKVLAQHHPKVKSNV
jgi:hypothetical protein